MSATPQVELIPFFIRIRIISTELQRERKAPEPTYLPQ